MGIIIKKISKKTIVSFASLAGLALALLSRLFFGGSHLNLSELEGRENGRTIGGSLVNVAEADSVTGDSASADSASVGDSGGDAGGGNGGDSNGSGDSCGDSGDSG